MLKVKSKNGERKYEIKDEETNRYLGKVVERRKEKKGKKQRREE